MCHSVEEQCLKACKPYVILNVMVFEDSVYSALCKMEGLVQWIMAEGVTQDPRPAK